MSQSLINSQAGIDRLCRRLSGEAAIAVDTEFLRVRTYFPRLALIQIATDDDIHVVDPLADGLDLDGLWAILVDPDMVKVMHAARQDVEVLLDGAGAMPGPLYDTQIAAALAGYAEQIGYAGLVEAEFGEQLPKAAQRTDWTRRPLSGAQLGYAANDVRYLLTLRERMSGRLAELGRTSWALEEFGRLLDPALYHVDPGQAYRRVARGADLDAPAQHALRHLCAWREETARRRNRPRGWVLDDESAAALAAARPHSVAALERSGLLAAAAVRRDGEAVVDCLNRPAAGADPLWRRQAPPSAAQKALRGRLISALKQRAAALGIERSLLLRRAELERLVRGDALDDVVAGWRRQAVGEELRRVLEAAPAVAPGGVS